MYRVQVLRDLNAEEVRLRVGELQWARKPDDQRRRLSPMSITREHTQELLHRAYVLAVAAAAGLNISMGSLLDYGTDIQVNTVAEFEDANGTRKLDDAGLPLKMQLKSTMYCRDHGADISYDCKQLAYNKLIRQNTYAPVPTILVVLCLPEAPEDWLDVSHDALTLRNACYWYYLTGTPTTQTSQVIHIPRNQLFTVAALSDIMERINIGLTP